MPSENRVTMDSAAQETMKNIKADFTRCGKALKSIHRVIEELKKCAFRNENSMADSATSQSISSKDEVKISELEDKVSKALMEIQRAVDKKLAVERRREAIVAEQERKEKDR